MPLPLSVLDLLLYTKERGEEEGGRELAFIRTKLTAWHSK